MVRNDGPFWDIARGTTDTLSWPPLRKLQDRPLDALQTLDRDDAVFYIGTFSKSAFPALRLGFIVSPPWARLALIAAKQVADGHCPVLPQDTLAAFITEGHLARHIRKMRKVYRERHDASVATLARHCPSRLEPLPAAAGLHVSARLTAPIDATDIAVRAGADINIEALDRYAFGRNPMFGYGVIETSDIDPAMRMLGRLLR